MNQSKLKVKGEISRKSSVKLKVKVEISRKSSVFTNGNKNNHRDSLFQYSANVYILYRGIAVFIDG